MYVKFIAADTAQDFEDFINKELEKKIDEPFNLSKTIQLLPSEHGFYCLIIFE